jgi:predicted RNA-binding protein with PIN domain
MPYLIDGHNLIPKLGLRLDSPDDEMQLVGILQEFARLSRREVQVYFDGAPPTEARTRKYGTVTAHFVRQGSSADEAIKSQVQRLGRAAQNWTVVTSDRAIQASARAAHASIMTSEDFAAHVSRLRRSADKAGGEPELSDDEIKAWLKLFDKRG